MSRAARRLKTPSRKILLPAAIVSALALSAASVAIIARGGADSERNAEAAEAMTPARARALGAEWRSEPANKQRATAYGDALLAAGLYDELLAEIETRGLFEGEAANPYRAAAALQLGRYDEARAASMGAGPYAAFARARADYALTGDADAARAGLAPALRAGGGLAAEGWLFRARLALDEGDFTAASAALRRAGEAGADRRAVERLEIEADIRAGREGAAAARLAARAKKTRSLDGAARLYALIELRRGDPNAAARLIDRTRAPEDRLLAALARRQAGDLAQASMLVTADLAAAPRNVVALDLGAAIAADQGDFETRDERLARLAEIRPGLGALRLMRLGRANDMILSTLEAAGADPATEGAAERLLGADKMVRGLEPASAAETSVIALATALGAGNPRAIRPAADNALAQSRAPLTLLLASRAYAKTGDAAKAESLAADAMAADGDFLAAAQSFAKLRQNAGANDEAATVLRRFVERHPQNGAAQIALAEAEIARGDMAKAAAAYAGAPSRVVFADQSNAASYGAAARAAGGDSLTAMIASARANSSSARILAAALLGAGDDAGAAAALRRALINAPQDAELRRLYLETMTRLGRADEAGALLARLDPARASSPAADDATTGKDGETG